MRRETIVRLEKGQYNPSLKLAVDIAREFGTLIENVFIFPEGEGEGKEVQRSDFKMLEAGYIDLYDEAYQKGFEIGFSKASLGILATMVGEIKTFLSEERWERYKKAAEDRHTENLSRHPEERGKCSDFFDEDGHIIKEKWVKEKKNMLDCMGFHEGSWDEICAFIEKYPELSPGALARRIVRESEYKYI